ncbi:MAG: phospho-sugar mutase [Actinomycetota bacterium]
MPVPDCLAAQARDWIAGDPDLATRQEMQSLLDAGDTAALTARFAGPLTFGTAGLRGPLGAGPSRMNVATVRAASAGLARWLHDHGTAVGGVVVGFDHRHGSHSFARDTAGVLAATGIPVYLAARHWPTPITAHAVRHLHAGAGVMVTASHNPAPDNGYKVYDETGAQIIPPVDAEIALLIASIGPAADIPCDEASPLITRLGDEAIAAYLDDSRQCVPTGPRSLKVVYTPVHGVGLAVFRPLWQRVGFPPALVVGDQADPDPDFPTAPFPNPEEPGVLDLALTLASRKNADIVLANDPDADRLAVAVPDGRAWRVLTGDEIGAVLGAHMLASTTGDDRVVARSIVSSRMLDRIAAAAGVPCRVTLTGFKWIARAGDPDGRRLVFGYEEALGYTVMPAVRDKDGLTAAVAMADLAARRPVLEFLDELSAAHGVHVTAQWSRRFSDMATARAFVATIRARPPRRFDAVEVARVVDYATGVDGVPPADLLAFELADGSRVLVRPSGTEPKVKCYFEVVEASGDRPRAEERLRALRTAVADSLGREIVGNLPA